MIADCIKMFFPLHFSFESASFQIKAPEPDQRFFLLIRIIHLTNGFPLLLLFFYFYFSLEFDTLCFYSHKKFSELTISHNPRYTLIDLCCLTMIAETD